MRRSRTALLLTLAFIALPSPTYAIGRGDVYLDDPETPNSVELLVINGYSLTLNLATMGETIAHFRLDGQENFTAEELGSLLVIKRHEKLNFPGAIGPNGAAGLLTVVCESGTIYQFHLVATNDASKPTIVDIRRKAPEPPPLGEIAQVPSVIDIPVPPAITSQELPVGGPTVAVVEPPAEVIAEVAQVEEEPQVGEATAEPIPEVDLKAEREELRRLREERRQLERQRKAEAKAQKKLAKQRAKLQQRLEREQKRRQREQQRLARLEQKRAEAALEEAVEPQQQDTEVTPRVEESVKTEPVVAVAEAQPTVEPTQQPEDPITLAHALRRGLIIARSKGEIKFSRRRGSAYARLQSVIGMLNRGMSWDQAVKRARIPAKFAADVLQHGKKQ